MDWTPEKITALVTAISAAVIGIFSKQVVDSLMRMAHWWREGQERRAAHKLMDEELNTKGHKFIIRRLDRQIRSLEKVISEMRDENVGCRAEYLALKAECDRLTQRLTNHEKNCH